MTTVEAHHGVATRQQLVAAGLGARQIDRWVAGGRLVVESRGALRIAGAPPTLEGRALAAIRASGGGAWASHHTAAALWGLGVDSADPRVELVRPYGLSAGRSGIWVHRSTLLPDHHLTIVRRVPVTTVPRTLFDLARTTGPHRLDRAIERALRGQSCTVAGLYRVFFDLGGRGRPGTRRLRAQLDARGVDYVPTESELDEVGRSVLSTVPGIEWQVPMSDEQGYIRRVDVLVRRSRVVIEFDGAPFHTEPSDVAHDAICDARLVATGHVVARFGWTALTRRAEVTRAEVDRLVSGVAA
ncbi:type IV toxin-antitoxin system AbiEi family antitoxin domain-containing protein [Iamia sp.]|uniref:type IV toxin-antitoxin system AbiEi family antitoxin domain-containing protein n=1 Tax=Iamia sp. TaxID=2722710 RepID=UPI002C3C2833|nr:type IV toxin-antitoxin system AbiEi family antitoxin domain-containing protein [Iamia sp.]HXH55704.1 type IV toxin-antitoxin system AbiEi family antitoxin domain-containing protein [Iamia sp.]